MNGSKATASTVTLDQPAAREDIVTQASDLAAVLLMSISDEPLEPVSTASLLPPGFEIVPKLLTVMRDPDAPSEELVDVVRLDPGLTADVLKVCNSAAFGGSCSIHSIPMAVNRLGLRELYRVALKAVASSAFRKMDRIGTPIALLWEHSLATAVTAQVVASRISVDPEIAFTAGLLHDIGKLAFWQKYGEEYRPVHDNSRGSRKSLSQAERDRFGIDHAGLGGRMLKEWKIPEDVASAVEFHHDLPEEEPVGILLRLIRVSNYMSHAIVTREEESFSIPDDLLDGLDLSSRELVELRDEIERRLEREKALLS